MRKTIWVALVLFSFASIAPAQNRFNTKWRCSSPSAIHTVAVGDEPNHNFTIIQGNCKSTASAPDFPESECVYTEFQEMRSASVSVHGRMNVIMKNGDRVFYSYEGSFPADISKPFSQRFILEGGTGQYKSVKGSGSCSGMVQPDGTGDMECVGRFSLAR
jgi:hypothetical protein